MQVWDGIEFAFSLGAFIVLLILIDLIVSMERVCFFMLELQSAFL